MQYPLSDPTSRLHAGKFADADPANGIPGSIDKARDMRVLYDELLALIQTPSISPAIAPSETDLTQVRQAVIALITNAIAGVRAGVATSLDTLFEISRALNYDPNFYANIQPLLVQPGVIQLVASTTAPLGTIKANGPLLNRADFPRLWAHAQASGLLVSEASWAASNRGMFSTGNGTTTFRAPDVRGEFLRPADDGRGLDVGRAIGTEQDATVIAEWIGQAGFGYLNAGVQNGDGTFYAAPGYALYTGSSAGTATVNFVRMKPRNVALLAVIHY